MAEANNVAVIGGGISGLACAWRLRKLGVPVTLFESEERPGGLIGTVERDGFLFESGPQSFQGTEPLLALIRQLGIESELCQASPRLPRFVLQRGKLQKIPMSPQGVLTSSLLSAGSRWKVVSEPLRHSKPPSEEESVANFVRRKFGHEILEYLVSPFVSGVYAGDPEKLSLRAAFPTLEEWEREYGSVIRGAMKSRPKPANGEGKRRPPSLCSFKRGVGTLAGALAEQLGASLLLRSKTCAIARVSSGASSTFQIHAEHSGQVAPHPARAIVMATPAYTASHLLASISVPLAQILSGIAYAGVAVIAAGYYAQQISSSLDGFGFLIPRSENIRTLGTVWNSSLFAGRAPEGSAAITSIAGGATDTKILDKSEAEIAALVQTDNAKIVQIAGPPVVSSVWKHPKALPQYNLGHSHTVAAIREFEQRNPGIFFSGNYLEGPSLGKCVEHGFKTAEAVRDFLAVSSMTRGSF